ncbi:hypothetical protein DFJ74DRAFT_16661 [Hyaloraphidium curvatum]|nr:hypothetical protein DFJ74DRAFT_16661 [Hyaloraphidium curvatum]
MALERPGIPTDNERLHEQVAELELKRRRARDKLVDLEGLIFGKRRHCAEVRRSIAESVRTENAVLERLNRADHRTGPELPIQSNEMRLLLGEIEGLEDEIADLGRRIEGEERRSRKLDSALLRLQSRFSANEKAIREMEEEEHRLLNEIADCQKQHSHQESLVTAVRNETSLRERVLGDARDATTSVRDTVEADSRENDSVKSFIEGKKHELRSLQSAAAKLSDSARFVSLQCDGARSELASLLGAVAECNMRHQAAKEKIAELDAELHAHQTALQFQESKLGVREDELRSVLHQIKTNEASNALALQDVAALQLQAADTERTNSDALKRLNLRMEADVEARTTLEAEERLEQFLSRITDQILHEKMMATNLESALKGMNLHRWRDLDTSDPESLALLQERRRLQRLCIRGEQPTST